MCEKCQLGVRFDTMNVSCKVRISYRKCDKAAKVVIYTLSSKCEISKNGQILYSGVIKLRSKLPFFSVLGLETDADLMLAEKHMQAMARILHKLICDGMADFLFAKTVSSIDAFFFADVKLHEPDQVREKLEQSIRSREDLVDSNCCVRARGLPWQASDQDIARFFIGLNVARYVSVAKENVCA